MPAAPIQQRVHPYSTLTPDVVVESIEALGHVPDGRVLALNSYENRVYQVGRDDAPPVVVKFYRPGRWTTPAILEEHEFALELARAEVPVVAPEVHEGRTLFELAGFRYAVYPRQGGRWPELGTRDERAWMGAVPGAHPRDRAHAAVPSPRAARLAGDGRRHRCDYLLEQGWIPPHIEAAYTSVARRRAGDRGAAVRARPRRTARCACTATATPATCCGPTTVRISWISTTA